MKEGVTQKAEGNVGLIQIAELKDSVVYQVVNGIQTREDLDPAIAATHQHIEALQRRKGMRDGRIILLIIVTVTISAALLKPSLYSIPLILVGAAGIYAGQRLERFISRIDTEMAAGNAVLGELYKQKIWRQIGGQDNCETSR